VVGRTFFFSPIARWKTDHVFSYLLINVIHVVQDFYRCIFIDVENVTFG
jgi:hypothetical protein